MTETTIFENYGIRVKNKGTEYFIEYDSGESAGSHIARIELTKEQADRAMINEHEAYKLILRLSS